MLQLEQTHTDLLFFNKGYYKVDEQKVERVFAFVKSLQRSLVLILHTNDKVVHTISRYMDYKGRHFEVQAIGKCP